MNNLQKEIIKQRVSQQYECSQDNNLSQSLSQNKSAEKYTQFKNQRTQLNDFLNLKSQTGLERTLYVNTNFLIC